MSVTLSRFVRVMTDGKVVTNKLVDKLDAKLTARIALVQALIDDIDQYPGVTTHGLQDQLKELQGVQTRAGANHDNATRSELLDTANSAAKRVIAAAQQRLADAPRLAMASFDAKIGAGLDELAKTNAQIPDAPLQTVAATKLAALTARRTALATAGDDGLDLADRLLTEVGWAQTWSDFAIKYGTGQSKAQRELARNGAAHYLLEGTKLARNKNPEKKAQGDKLVEVAKQLRERLDAVEEDAKRNPKEAVYLFTGMTNAYNAAKALYETAFLAPGLTEKAAKLVKANPNGPEARMQDALSPQMFQSRMLAAYNIALSSGMPEIGKLTPGEAVAIFSYTTSDYTAMNDVLLGNDIKGGAAAKRKVNIQIEEAKKALAKLPPLPVNPASRGERAWPPGDAQQYTKGNEFTLKIFWSSGVGFSFPGPWQITVFGKSGRNVAGLSNAPHECEVLFAPGARFKVKSVTRTGDGGRVVVEEV